MAETDVTMTTDRQGSQAKLRASDSLTTSSDKTAQVNLVDLERLVQGRHGDPFALLGPHRFGEVVVVRALLPSARAVWLHRLEGDAASPGKPVAFKRLAAPSLEGLFELRMPAPLDSYVLGIEWPGTGAMAAQSVMQTTFDPYAFGPLLSDFDLYLISEGRHRELGRCLGARSMVIDGVAGVRFAVWAPNAQRVAVVGDFNSWDGRRHAMRLRHGAGVWEIFLPGVQTGALYKYEIIGNGGQRLPLKADPVALFCEKPPHTASVVVSNLPFEWNDGAWMSRRAPLQTADAPLSIYEVHSASWLRLDRDENWSPSNADGRIVHWNALADHLIPYVRAMGFTHIELLPVMEHPFGGSWGYQPLGLFAPTARHGSPADFAYFVDRCHQAGLGVILDWVPGHFPSDSSGLERFDGTALYEYDDPREGVHRDWNTLIFNLGRNEVRGFMIASALHWIEHYHIDGLRVDAVTSMLYRDYSRKPGEWLPNVHGGRENLEAIAFLRELNETIAECCPGAITIAEESTAWPGVTAAVKDGGLGFNFKWNMGWMHDTLQYMGHEPVHRRWHHDHFTFGLVYAFSEKFILPLSHDEVVHGKASLSGRMPGDRWQRFANLRAYYGFMWSHPGKKLLFMGGEIAQPHEWNHDMQIDWNLLDDPLHRGVQHLVRDLNRIYREQAALHAFDTFGENFIWLVGDDREQSVFAYLWRGRGDIPGVMAIVNMTPLPRHDYRIGVPREPQSLAGAGWREILNTDSEGYGGSNVGNRGRLTTQAIDAHGHECSIVVTLPPLATLLLLQENIIP